jgi:hypothetical protein
LLAFCGFVAGAEQRRPCGAIKHSPLQLELKKRMSMDDVKNGQRINCNGLYGTIIGKRSTRNQRFVLVKMDNGFTLKLKADALSVELPETDAIAQLNGSTKQLASVD